MMKRASSYVLLALFVVGAAVSIGGCSKDAATEPAADRDATQDAAQTAAVDEAEDDVFAGLPEADRIAAMAQKTCPVTDEALGSMGTPIKLTIEGRDVYLCCDGCVEELQKDPAKYIAKLDASAGSASEAADAEAPADATTDESGAAG
jgi:hypothetical protein